MVLLSSIQSDHLLIIDWMMPPLGTEYSHGKTQYIPGKQVLVRSQLFFIFLFFLLSINDLQIMLPNIKGLISHWKSGSEYKSVRIVHKSNKKAIYILENFLYSWEFSFEKVGQNKRFTNSAERRRVCSSLQSKSTKATCVQTIAFRQ